MRRSQPPVINVVGVNHRTASVEQRERLAFLPAELPSALKRLGSDLGGAAILSTCNRTEVYASLPADPGQGERLIGLLMSVKGIDASIYPSRFYLFQHADAVRHLYRVATGVDSLVLGEAQILGQVRDALAAAQKSGSLNGVLSRLFHSAIAVGKRARRETGIGRYAVSVSSTAVTLAKAVFGSLEERTVLVISAGSTAKLAAKSLAESGASRILVTNRTYERAQELAQRLGGQPVAFERLAEALASSDIVISATGADSFVLGPELVAPAMAGPALPAGRRNGRDLLLIDIAVPRDVDPAVRDIPGVRLFDIDDLEVVSQTNLEGRQQEVARVEAIVEEEVGRFLAWWRSLDVVPTIASLRWRAETIRRSELDKAFRRLPDLTPEEQARIEAMTAAIVKKMLHDPIARLKGDGDTRRQLEAAQTLFGTPPESQIGPER